MRKMQWSPECKTGFEEIDSQHRLLFAISNEILDIENPLKQQDEVKYLLHHLIDYVDKHFKTNPSDCNRIQKYDRIKRTP